jgi:hypothetical protein
VSEVQKKTIIVEGDKFRNAPAETIERVCDFVGVSYKPELLHWDEGNIRAWKPSEFQSQAKFHATLECSNTILPASPRPSPQVKSEHREFLSRAQAIYDELTAF